MAPTRRKSRFRMDNALNAWRGCANNFRPKSRYTGWIFFTVFSTSRFFASHFRKYRSTWSYILFSSENVETRSFEKIFFFFSNWKVSFTFFFFGSNNSFVIIKFHYHLNEIHEQRFVKSEIRKVWNWKEFIKMCNIIFFFFLRCESEFFLLER